MTQGGADELRGLLREALEVRLGAAGWSAVEDDGSRYEVASFLRPIGGDFAATAEFRCESTRTGRPVRIMHVLVGVCYEPLRRLWPLLGVYRVSVLTEDVHDVDEDDPGRAEEPWQLVVGSSDQAIAAADELAGLVLDRAVAFARRYAGVDTLLAEFADDEDSERIHMAVPALLAAAGRFDEARDALSGFRAELGPPGSDREARRFARQLLRWIDSGGNPALLAITPPPPRFQPSPSKSISETWREARALRDAVEAVRKVRADKDRAELRSALEAQLAERDLSESPIWFEQTLDQLESSRAEQAQRNAQSLKQLGRLGLGVVRAIRTRELPDLSRPDWLEPPDRAAYPVPLGQATQWTTVELQSSASEWLTRVHAALPRLGQHTVPFDAWLDWDSDHADASRLALYVGEQQVGTLDRDATIAYRPVMNAAAQRDELPFATARLTPRPPSYLLELQLPL